MRTVGEVGCTMRRYRENPKSPDIDVLARHYLERGLSKLPDLSKHVADVADVEKMGMRQASEARQEPERRS
jgi:hypothetical protein